MIMLAVAEWVVVWVCAGNDGEDDDNDNGDDNDDAGGGQVDVTVDGQNPALLYN